MADKMTLKEVAEAMKDIDFAMLNTHTKNGQIGARPMSNNREVDYDGDNYFFTWKDSLMVKDIKDNNKVGLSMQGKDMLFLSVEADAKLVEDKAAFKKHWNKELNRWFKDGPDTDGLIMIHVAATRIAYWQKELEGEIIL